MYILFCDQIVGYLTSGKTRTRILYHNNGTYPLYIIKRGDCRRITIIVYYLQIKQTNNENDNNAKKSSTHSNISFFALQIMH